MIRKINEFANQLSDSYTSTMTDLSVTITKITKIAVMHTIIITAGICFTQTQMLCHLFEGMIWIQFPIQIGHFSPELSIFGELDAFLRMSVDGSHWCVVLNK
jgi:hypothetical protein